jgi:beta-phosphoglucomutase-like phosphatase (HAD superfamily)
MHLVMFDVDGTLVDSDGFDGELYAAAVEAETGLVVDRDWDRYEHVSDGGILAQMLREARRGPERGELAVRVQRRFAGLVREYLRHNRTAVAEIAGAKRLVERLRTLPNVRVAIATGGWAETALLKLAHVGIDAARLGFASSSDAHARAEIMRLAAQRALRGESFTRATYFGDGPWDRRASLELEYDFIGVGGAVQHPTAYPDLDDTEAILAQLDVAANEGVARRA